MTIQKDYKAVASIIKQEYTRFDNTGEDDAEAKLAIKCIAMNMANYFVSDNKRFNRDVFLDACGIGE